MPRSSPPARCRPRRCRCSAWSPPGPGRARWWRRTLEGRADLERLYRTDADPDLDFNGAPPTTRRSPTRGAPGARSRARPEVYAGLDLDALVEVHGDDVEARDIVVHLVEEYARHAGHADLLRECIDGRTGQ